MQEGNNLLQKSEKKQNTSNQKIECELEKLNLKQFPIKKLYAISTILGNLTIEVIRFQFYLIIIVCYTSVLKLDGYMQVGYLTPYNENPTVLNLAKYQGQFQNQKICQSLSKQTKCPVFLSLNVEVGNKKEEQELINVLCQILAK